MRLVGYFSRFKYVDLWARRACDSTAIVKGCLDTRNRVPAWLRKFGAIATVMGPGFQGTPGD